MNEIDVDHITYLNSLLMGEGKVSRVYSMDGAGLYRITDEHYVIVCCSTPECAHRGKLLLERVMPREWICFHAGANTDDGFEAYHYGPEA